VVDWSAIPANIYKTNNNKDVLIKTLSPHNRNISRAAAAAAAKEEGRKYLR
jgi:hypothetical protein